MRKTKINNELIINKNLQNQDHAIERMEFVEELAKLRSKLTIEQEIKVQQKHFRGLNSFIQSHAP